MIFFSKRGNTQGRSSNVETFISILGLFLAIGILGGLAALIYGLVKGISSGIIGGAIVCGVSILFSIILALVFIFCLKKNNVDLNPDDRQSRPNQRQHKQNRQIKHVQNIPHETVRMSGINKYDQQIYSPPIHNDGLTNNMNYSHGKQISQTSTNPTSVVYLNQSNGLMTSNNKRNSYNRH